MMLIPWGPHRQPRTLRRSVLTATAQAAAVTAALAGAWLASATVGGVGPTVTPGAGEPDRQTRLMAELRCSSTRPADGTTPASALIRTRDAGLQQVSVDRGRAAYRGDQPGVLVAVCRAPLR